MDHSKANYAFVSAFESTILMSQCCFQLYECWLCVALVENYSTLVEQEDLVPLILRNGMILHQSCVTATVSEMLRLFMQRLGCFLLITM